LCTPGICYNVLFLPFWFGTTLVDVIKCLRGGGGGGGGNDDNGGGGDDDDDADDDF